MTKIGYPHDEYDILEDIGNGSFGSVQKAKSKATSKIVAIKTMKRKFDNVAECEKLLESRLLTLLPPHQNVVQLYDTFYTPENDLCFVMEYMEGGNLYQLMNQRRKANEVFSIDELRHIFYQILSAVAHIHSHGIFHRDMKPENLLISFPSSSGEPVIKLADFGLARELQSNPPYTEYVSTRWYRAPEVLLRSTSYSSAVDLWAIGAIFAELITLHPLFPGESEIDQLYRICELMGSPGNNRPFLRKGSIKPEKRLSPGFARKKLPTPSPLDRRRSISSVPARPSDGIVNEWREGVKLAHKIGFEFPQLPPKPLISVLPTATASMLDLIRQFLCFNPTQRLKAAEALNHPFFTDSSEQPVPNTNSLSHGFRILNDTLDTDYRMDMLSTSAPEMLTQPIYPDSESSYRQQHEWVPSDLRFEVRQSSGSKTSSDSSGFEDRIHTLVDKIDDALNDDPLLSNDILQNQASLGSGKHIPSPSSGCSIDQHSSWRTSPVMIENSSQRYALHDSAKSRPYITIDGPEIHNFDSMKREKWPVHDGRPYTKRRSHGYERSEQHTHRQLGFHLQNNSNCSLDSLSHDMWNSSISLPGTDPIAVNNLQRSPIMLPEERLRDTTTTDPVWSFTRRTGSRASHGSSVPSLTYGSISDQTMNDISYEYEEQHRNDSSDVGSQNNEWPWLKVL
ncbi:kinase-like domain-containing protein [Radiomyces spectabilis]|uniref:kinase-like domain-containing protein n=1 Tax=Radiomyces spectabilis TaxID=64574 RepID=UPI00221E62D0|nr:kinase-like domain-containing protein [Radiomyces spectabilis]KAI8391154.1 kinase-like domain-containing protein [Radiomyces spectabilis]